MTSIPDNLKHLVQTQNSTTGRTVNGPATSAMPTQSSDMRGRSGRGSTHHKSQQPLSCPYSRQEGYSLAIPLQLCFATLLVVLVTRTLELSQAVLLNL
jgi:hypothetical protein